MNCSIHTEESAVGQCQLCGAYVCKNCAELTQDVQEFYGVICPKCFVREAQNGIAQIKKENRKNVIRLIISIATYILGLIMIIEGVGHDVGLIILGIIFCGFYKALTTVGRMARGETRDLGFFGKLFVFVVCVAIGAVYTPIRCIMDVVLIIKNIKLSKNVKANVDYITQWCNSHNDIIDTTR